MGKEAPYLHLFSVRCTLLAFHALIWSFLQNSKPEYLNSSIDKMSEKLISKHLKAVLIIGYISLAINFVLTLCSCSIKSIPLHFLHIICHSIAILLIIVSILNYWNVKLLWIPTTICCIFPTIVEIVYCSFVIIQNRSKPHSKKMNN